MDSPAHPDSPMNDDDVAYPCKGCGEILEEGKAFELAGNRWHIDCFRCNTCKTLLDSDANLLLLGDGSLICNNCTYSCSACQNKIEDLAILTGDQAYCASCFKCRNCRRKIDNLRYARTSQGIFCMTCHESLMARKKKKSARGHTPQQQSKPASNSQSPMLLDKSLPSLPPTTVPSLSSAPNLPISHGGALTHTTSSTSLEPYSDPVMDTPSRNPQSEQSEVKPSRREKTAHVPEESAADETLLPSTTYNGTPTSQRAPTSDSQAPISPADPMGAFIPMMFDDRPAVGPSPHLQNQHFDQSSTRKNSAPEQSRSKDGNHSDPDHSSHPKSSGRRDGESRGQPKKVGSPHVAYQEKGRQPSSELTDLIRNRSRREKDREGPTQKEHTSNLRSVSGPDDSRIQHAAPPQVNGNGTSLHSDHFRLQEVPRSRKAGGSRQSSKSDIPIIQSNGVMDPISSNVRTDSPGPIVPKSSSQPIQPSSDSRSGSIQSSSSQLLTKPKREDSLPIQQHSKATARKEVPNSQSYKSISTSPRAAEQMSPPDPLGISMHPSPTSHDQGRSDMNGAQPILPTRSKGRPQQAPGDAYQISRSVQPSSLPNSLPTSGSQEPSPQSAGTVQTDYSRDQEPATSPTLPQYSTSGDFGVGMEDDFKRILAGNDEGANDLLEKVSKAVRHGRSASEAGVTRQEHIDPASIASPDQADEALKLKSELRHSAKRIAELEACISSTADIKSLDTKLREKRSTVAFLDSQRELVVNELEVLTKHVEQSKRTDQPLDLGSLTNNMIRDFAISLERLKDQYQGDVEDLIHQKNQLNEELASLHKLRDQAIEETRQLNMRNSQLADLNNELTQQIQERYKVHRHPSAGAQSDQVSIESPHSNGLGIYTHHHNLSGDQREFARPGTAGNSSLSTVVPPPSEQSTEPEPVTVLTAPHVVNIRKGQAKKFNWKKGGQSVAKGVSKGIKGAFSSSNQSHGSQSGHSQNQMPEAVPYGMHTPGDAPTIVNRIPPNDGGKPRNHNFADKLFGGNLAPRGPSPQQMRSYSNGNIHSSTPDGSGSLFGSDLSERAELERRNIPSIVTRCIEEVELRGMDVEGIYRKTGGNSLTKTIQEGFEQTNDYDISDPELDITSVTSALKQYFRHLPIPLVHFDIYDRMLQSTSRLPPTYFGQQKNMTAQDYNRITPEVESGVEMMKAAINALPQKHRDSLEFLIFHLARVVEREGENKMSPRNLAVVFAPTIMWDQNLHREMTDMHAKNDSIQFLIQHNKIIFAP